MSETVIINRQDVPAPSWLAFGDEVLVTLPEGQVGERGARALELMWRAALDDGELQKAGAGRQ